MCVSINYIYPLCKCTARVAWYTCLQARGFALGPSISADTLGEKRKRGVHEWCEKYKKSMQKVRCGETRCERCVREMMEVGAGSEEIEEDDVESSTPKTIKERECASGDSGLHISPLHLGNKGKHDESNIEDEGQVVVQAEIKPLNLKKAKAKTIEKKKGVIGLGLSMLGVGSGVGNGNTHKSGDGNRNGRTTSVSVEADVDPVKKMLRPQLTLAIPPRNSSLVSGVAIPAIERGIETRGDVYAVDNNEGREWETSDSDESESDGNQSINENEGMRNSVRIARGGSSRRG
jgi:hypothetical protein